MKKKQRSPTPENVTKPSSAIPPEVTVKLLVSYPEPLIAGLRSPFAALPQVIMELASAEPPMDLADAVAGQALAEDPVAEEVLLDLRDLLNRGEFTGRNGRGHMIQATPRQTQADRIGGLILEFIDITVRNRSKAELTATSERLRLLVETVQDYAVLTSDKEGKINYWNRGAEVMFGYPAAEILGELPHRLFTPEDRRQGAPEKEMRDAREYGRAADERWHLRKDGSRFFASGVMVPLRSQETGRLTGYAKIARNLTERLEYENSLRRSEERFRALVDKSSDVITVSNELGLVKYASPSIERVCGYSAEEYFDRDPLRDFSHPDDIENSLQTFQQVLANPGASYSLLHRCRHKNGSWRWLESTLTNLLNDEAVQGIVTNFRDVTDRIEAEEIMRNSHADLEGKVAERTLELSQMNAVLQEEVRERRKSELQRFDLVRRIIGAQEVERRRIARDMHDHLGQQLTALNLNISNLKESRVLDPLLFEPVVAIQSIAHQLDSDVDFLIWKLRPVILDDLGLAPAIESLTNNWSKQTGIPARLHIAGLKERRLDREVETVLYRITQEALNNVVKHARARHVDVVLECRSDQLSLIIEDDGDGFDSETAFGPNDKGLGLLGMRERTMLVGGTFEIESQAGRSTTVFVRIPQPIMSGTEDLNG